MNGNPLFVFIFCIVLFNSGLHSQNQAVLLPEFSYSWGFPAADLEKRFGSHLSLGVGLNFQPTNNHLNFGTRFSYFFGSDVKEDVLNPFRTSFGGLIIGSDEYLSELKLKERGFFVQVHTGGLVPIFSQIKARQSFKWQMGIGFIEHHIRFVDDARSLTQFTTDYLKGLDRLSNGWAIIPFVGYEYLSRNGWLSFYSGFEPVLAFTESRRSLDYDTNTSSLGIARTDILLNFKFALYLPLYISGDSEKIEY